MSGLIGLICPRGCAGCDVPDETLCPDCRALFGHVIARPLPGSAVGRAYACASYERRVRRAVLAWKDHGDEECDAEFAPLIAALAARSLPVESVIACPAPALDLLDTEDTDGADRAPGATGTLLIVPAPSSSASLAARGRRHLTPLARAVAAYYVSHGVDARVERALVFAKGRRPGANGVGSKSVETAGAVQRASRMGGNSLVVRKTSMRRGIRGESVVIVDDIITTGATMRACADALSHAGARVIAGLALAATPRYGASAG